VEIPAKRAELRRLILSLAAIPLVLLLRKPERRPGSTTALSWNDAVEAVGN